MEKTLHFISGLPRSGSTLITNLLKQNPEVHGESVTSLASLFGSINASWSNIEANQEYNNEQSKKGVMYSMLQGYYSHIDKPIVFDKDRGWIALLPQLEAVLDRKVKIVVCVRNPAEILTSFERLRKDNPLFFTKSDSSLREGSNISSRAFYYAGPEGALGLAHRNLKDVVTVDGLFFAVHKNRIKEKFDEEFDGFHFYDIPFCVLNHLKGVKIGVTTKIMVIHKSIGQVNEQWVNNKSIFEKKYGNNLPLIVKSF